MGDSEKGEEPTYDARPEVELTKLNHVYLWYVEADGHPLITQVWPVGCTREEALSKRPQMIGRNAKYALVRVPLNRDWLS